MIVNLWTGVPSLPSTRKAARAIVRAARLQPGETVMDPGAGFGRLLIEAKRAEPAVQAIGFEIAAPVWLLGSLRSAVLRHGIDLRYGNALKQSFAPADCLLVYAMPSFITLLEAKFDRELRPGTRVLSAVFRFPKHEPVREVPFQWLGEQSRIFEYRW